MAAGHAADVRWPSSNGVDAVQAEGLGRGDKQGITASAYDAAAEPGVGRRGGEARAIRPVNGRAGLIPITDRPLAPGHFHCGNIGGGGLMFQDMRRH